jgi:DNA segregation ATPase FtsK/SpoIIIE-like protein
MSTQATAAVETAPPAPLASAPPAAAPAPAPAPPPLTPEHQLILNAAFTRFMDSPPGRALLDAPAQQENEAIRAAFAEWMNDKANQKLPQVKAAAALVPGFTADAAGERFAVAKRGQAVNRAFAAFMQSPEGAAMATPDAPPLPDELPLPRPRVSLQARRNKPITVASTPMIGDYRLPSMDLLHHPDLTVKPTETKEELMANARLMVQTLAQFGIEVAPGDITKGPTITRYELHPAPGVKLEKIAGLTNNIAAAMKAITTLPTPGDTAII